MREFLSFENKKKHQWLDFCNVSDLIEWNESGDISLNLYCNYID